MPDSAVSSRKAAKRKPKPKLEPIPPSLLELVRQFEDAIAVASASKAGQEMTESAKFVTESGAVNTVQHINAFIESAWNGSMCKNEMGGRKVPLARAIRYLDTIMEATGSMILNAEDADDLGPIFNMKSDKFKMMCTTTFKQLSALDFTGFGTANYQLIHIALCMMESTFTGTDFPFMNEIHVLKHFSKHMVQTIAVIPSLTEGHCIANDIGRHGFAPHSFENDSVPEPLQQLVHNMEESPDRLVATCLGKYAKTFIEAAWSGSMCEKQLGRKLPLAEAISTIHMVLMTARFEYISNKEELIKDDSERDAFRSHAIASFSVFLAKNFDKLGIAEYDVISSSLDMNKGKQPFRDDAVVVKLFCERMLNLLRSDKQIRDNGIQRMPTAVLAADTAVGAVIGVEPMPPSLLLLQRQIEDVVAAACDGDSVTDVVANQNLTHYTREFIQSSWDGSMWESRFGRKVPLACAVHCLETVLEEVSTKILKVGGVFHMNMDLNFRKCCRMTFKTFIKLDFTWFGTNNYNMIRMGMTMIEEVLLKDGQHRHEIYVIQHFCDRIVAMLNTVEVLTGNRIANDVGYQKSAADAQLGNAVPVSLQQIVRKMEACNDHSIATDLARYANSLIDAAWSGSMCEKQLGRKIPLKEAIKGCTGAPLMAVRRCIKNLADKKLRKRVGASFEKLLVLDFAGIGVTEYDGISTTLAGVSVEGARQDDVFVIRQFCDRMSKLLQSIKGKTGYDIAKASNETFM